jgi:hypothetical protein
VRQPRSDHRARRWLLGLVLTLLALAPVFLCQAVSSSEPPPAASTAAVTVECDGAHDVLCSRGAAVAVGASTRSGRDGQPEPLLVLVVATALIGTTCRIPGALSRAPQRPMTGPQQLVALGIARI